VTSACAKRVAVPLLALPEAAEQRGRIAVRGNNGSVPLIEQTQLAPTPLPLTAGDEPHPDEPLPVRASYRFKPAECLEIARAPRLWISPAIESNVNPLVARRLALQSYYWPDGRGVHRAIYELDNFGATDFKPALAADAKILSITAGGQTLESAVSGDGK